MAVPFCSTVNFCGKLFKILTEPEAEDVLADDVVAAVAEVLTDLEIVDVVGPALVVAMGLALTFAEGITRTYCTPCLPGICSVCN